MLLIGTDNNSIILQAYMMITDLQSWFVILSC